MYFLLHDLDRCGWLNEAKMDEPIILDNTADIQAPLIYNAMLINTSDMFCSLHSSPCPWLLLLSGYIFISRAPTSEVLSVYLIDYSFTLKNR